MKILVTGGAGFIGSAVCRELIANTDHAVVNVDCLTYAANLDSLKDISGDPRYAFEQVDICDAPAMAAVFARHDPDAVMHLAAESHVDRSIDGPSAFIQTNLVGTSVMLEAARTHWLGLEGARKDAFRFHHISTDEVYGSLGPEGYFTEDTPYAPNSPYSASKAGSDHLVRAWRETYGLPTVLTNCSNNYGPFHFPEKLIPLMILNALEGKPLPVYGDGAQVRDWLHVEDHARALILCLTQGEDGGRYNIGGNNERTNLQVVKTICALLDELVPDSPHVPHEKLITHVADRPGHDRRYAIDASHIRATLGWEPSHTFETGMRETVQWYLNNEWWWRPIREGRYSGERLGVT